MSQSIDEAPAVDAPARAVPGRSLAADELNPFELLNAVLQSWRAMLTLVVVAILAVMVYWAVAPRTYTATVAFVPEARSQTQLPAGLAGFVGQLGLSLGSGTTESPRFYATVVKSRALMEQILLSSFPDPRRGAAPGDSLRLLQFLGVGGRNHADSLYNALKELDQLVSADVDNATNIVQVSVDARDPAVAAAVANRFVEYLNTFNAKSRESRARARRKFTEERVGAAADELRVAEAAVKTFYERNHGWQQSPELVLVEASLRRQVTIGQEVYLTLRREYETARIEEVNDTPVITVIEPAATPQRPSKPHLAFLLSLAVVVSGFAGLAWALFSRYVSRARHEYRPPYREFVSLRHQARREIGNALSALTSKLRR